MLKIKVKRSGTLSVPIPCPGCGRKTKVPARNLRNGATVRCAGCGESVRLGGEAGKLGRSLQQLDRTLNRIGK